MSSLAAASFALRGSREAMPAISLHSPFCIAGITFFTAIAATPSTPHFTFCSFTWSPFPAARFVLSSFACSVRACRAISLFKFFFRAHRPQILDSVDTEDSIQMIDFVLEQLGKISHFASLNLARLALQILILHGDVAIPFNLHEDRQKTEASIPNDDAFVAAFDDFWIHERPRVLARQV